MTQMFRLYEIKYTFILKQRKRFFIFSEKAHVFQWIANVVTEFTTDLKEATLYSKRWDSKLDVPLSISGQLSDFRITQRVIAPGMLCCRHHVSYLMQCWTSILHETISTTKRGQRSAGGY